MPDQSTTLAQRMAKLQDHLAQENPILLDVVKSFRELDRVAHQLGMMSRDESFATRVPWWPMVSVLGTFSSGKSTFLNDFLGHRLQKTGNQAVDDKFTVLCFGSEGESRTLPGRALDGDPRFPFYQMSTAIDEVAPGEGPRIDVYLQLKTCPSERLRGKIFIDSPGFDADEQRNSTLRITDHIMDLSDLVLVFFDARHPEPGAMQDTLQHLVAETIHRADSNKFLYILNQIDNAAREDNPEEVFAAWHRALAQKGLTAGRFYRTYSPEAAIEIENPQLRRRFEEKRDEDMAEIEGRVGQVEVERAYRIIGVLEQAARSIEERVMPAVSRAKVSWRRWLWLLDALLFGGIVAAFLAWSIAGAHWTGLSFQHPWWLTLRAHPLAFGIVLAALAGGALYLHFLVRRIAARTVRAGLRRRRELEGVAQWVLNAFDHNTAPWRWSLIPRPAGWGIAAKRKIAQVLEDADRYVQALNSRFTDPSGRNGSPPGKRRVPCGPDPSRPPETKRSAAQGSDVVPDAPEVAH
jgi:hypothetical protein